MPQRQLSGRPGKILSRLPSFMRAATPGKSLGAVAIALGNDLDEAERALTALQRSHRLQVADHHRDVLGLSSLLELEPADFFVLRSLYERGYFSDQAAVTAPEDQPLPDLAREELGYELYLGELRDSVGRAARVLLEGCGTIWALLEGAAILIDADRLDADGQPNPEARIVNHLDAGLPQGGFVHSIRVRYHTLEDEQPVEEDGSVFLVENPIVDRSTDDTERRQREHFPVTRGGFFDGPVAIQITGVGGRTVKPLMINRTTHEGVGFDGVLAEGQVLVFTAEGTVLLDGVDVTDKGFFLRGALAGDPRTAGAPPLPEDSFLDGERPEDLFVVVDPAHAMDRNRPRPTVNPGSTIPGPLLRLGESHWRFSVEEGAFDASGFDEAVYLLPLDPAALAALPASGKVKLMWKEHEPFAASVLIPSDLASLEDAGLVDQSVPTLVRAGLERFRAAGIRLDVLYFDEEWILGRSVLKELDAPPGPGTDFNATIPSSDEPEDGP